MEADGKPRVSDDIVGAEHCPGIVGQIWWMQKDPDSRRTTIDGLRDIMETK